MSRSYTPRHARTERARTGRILAWGVRHAPAVVRAARVAWAMYLAFVDPAGGFS